MSYPFISLAILVASSRTMFFHFIHTKNDVYLRFNKTINYPAKRISYTLDCKPITELFSSASYSCYSHRSHTQAIHISFKYKSKLLLPASFVFQLRPLLFTTRYNRYECIEQLLKHVNNIKCVREPRREQCVLVTVNPKMYIIHNDRLMRTIDDSNFTQTHTIP